MLLRIILAVVISMVAIALRGASNDTIIVYRSSNYESGGSNAVIPILILD